MDGPAERGPATLKPSGMIADAMGMHRPRAEREPAHLREPAEVAAAGDRRRMLPALQGRLLLMLATATVCLGGTGAAAASSQPARGRLTSSEYTRLSLAQADLKQALSARSPNWSRARRACSVTGTGTALLASQHSVCLTTVTFFDAIMGFPADVKRCGQKVPHKDFCLVPYYQNLARSATASYRSSVAAYRIAVKRGFTGTCLAVLVGTAKQLRQAQQLVAATVKVTDDMATTAAVLKGKLPVSDVNQPRFTRDAADFARDLHLVLSSNGPDNLAVCPHA